MCCLFGILDYKGLLSHSEKSRLLRSLSIACEARGVDATGYSYNSKGKLLVYKRPIPARWMRFRLPADAAAVMGHTRMTTQGSEINNYNNHPFRSRAGTTAFALAHNGVLHNDNALRKEERLPVTNVETDSFVAVQLLEKAGVLNAKSLCSMAEKLRGSFTITVLDERDNLWFVKGDNPMCLYHYEALGIYVYASTQEILNKGLRHTILHNASHTVIPLSCGEILKIDAQGRRSVSRFTFTAPAPILHPYRWHWDNQSHLDQIKNVAPAFGLTAGDIDALAREGMSPEEIEDWLYCG